MIKFLDLQKINHQYQEQFQQKMKLVSDKGWFILGDEVKTFDSDNDLIDIIRTYEPDIMVKGSDYKDQPIVGSEFCKKIVFYDRIDEYSTTKKIQDIINR